MPSVLRQCCVGGRKGHPACKKAECWYVGCDDLSEARCKWFARFRAPVVVTGIISWQSMNVPWPWWPQHSVNAFGHMVTGLGMSQWLGDCQWNPLLFALFSVMFLQLLDLSWPAVSSPRQVHHAGEEISRGSSKRMLTKQPTNQYRPMWLRGCKHRRAPFPGWMSYKATKPGSVCPLFVLRYGASAPNRRGH